MIPFNDENKARMSKVADYLLGTCKSVDEGIQDEFGEDVELQDIDIKLLKELDDIAFCCEACGWWSEISMAAEDGGICTDCEDDE